MPRGPRLELTWPNKDQFLLVPRDDEGRPKWVSRDHPAAQEVRLPNMREGVGLVSESEPLSDNLMFIGDSLDVLRILRDSPEYRKLYRGKVKLIYIDPPFNSGATFGRLDESGKWVEHYDDAMDHSTWLSFMQERLLLMKDLLADDGSIWVHVDDYEVHRLRCLMDEVFGSRQWVNTVVWGYKTYQGAVKDYFPRKHDSILWYNKRDRPDFELPYQDNIEDTVAFKRWEKYLTPQNTIVGANFPSTDSRFMAYYRRWVTEHGREPGPSDVILSLTGEVVTDTWTDIPAIDPKDKVNRNGYSTQKPEPLLARIITAATSPGDIVLDVFGGSLTTAATAHKLGRRWVTADISPLAIADFGIPRLTSVVDGEDSGGISSTAKWTGGGGFRVVEVGPSMYEVDDDGQVLLAEWATNGRFAKAVAGQLGFTWQSKAHAPFCGVRGRMRLAVLDGAVGVEEVRHIVSCLGEGQRVTIVAKSVLPGSEDLLRELSPGSRIRKAPRDLLGTGRPRPRRKVEATAPDVDDALLAWVITPEDQVAIEQADMTRPLVSPGR